MKRALCRLCCAGVVLSLLTGIAGAAAANSERPRLVVLTDYFKDPDDKQSLIRLLVHANEFELEGLIATSLAFGDGAVRPDLLLETIDDYAAVHPNLRQHEARGYPFPDPAALRAMVKAGAPVVRRPAGGRKGFPVSYPAGQHDARESDPPEKWLGPGRDTAASEHLIAVVDRDDPRPVWVAVWGGPMDLAQALWKVRHTRSAAETSRFVAKLRVYQISWQDAGAVWLWENFPHLFRIQSNEVGRGLYREGPARMRDEAWLRAHVVTGHGPLGAAYPPANAGRGMTLQVKEGDSASFLHLLAPGLSDPEQPDWGGWGGRFRRLDPALPRYVDAHDRHPESDEPARETGWTIGRWTEAIANEFAARMDWCVRPYGAANHPPAVHLEGDATRRVLAVAAGAGQPLTLSATGTHDPDGDALEYHWWHYVEPGTFRGPVQLEDSDSPVLRLIAPVVSAPESLHLILAVTDRGEPRLTRYRRAVVTVTPAAPGARSR